MNDNIRPTYYVRHPDGTYSEAPQPVEMTDEQINALGVHLKDVYFYDSAGKWRGSNEDTPEWQRWFAVATAAIRYLSAQAAPKVPEAKRCEYCDGTGDVHSIDGQWRGECTVCKPEAQAQASTEPPPAHSLPDWDECKARVDSGTATHLHQFIYDHDDADPNGSGWFLYRLEQVIEEAKAQAVPEDHCPPFDADTLALYREVDLRKAVSVFEDILDAFDWEDAEHKEAILECIADLKSMYTAPQLTAQPDTSEQLEWEHLKRYGYAPGNYMSRCRQCNATRVMDKRAVTCRDCAEKMYQPPAPSEQRSGLYHPLSVADDMEGQVSHAGSLTPDTEVLPFPRNYIELLRGIRSTGGEHE